MTKSRTPPPPVLGSKAECGKIKGSMTKRQVAARLRLPPRKGECGKTEIPMTKKKRGPDRRSPIPTRRTKMRQNRDPNDQREEILAKVMAHREVLACQGAVAETWRSCGGRKFGPYYRLAWLEDGRQRSIYLGASEELAQEVRRLLDEFQSHMRRQRTWRQQLAQVRKAFREHQRQWRRELRAHGLYARGLTVRGWRHWRPANSATGADPPD
jgi:hypothetical protein